jgi:hypothetical protein
VHINLNVPIEAGRGEMQWSARGHYNYKTAFILLGETLEPVGCRSQATTPDDGDQPAKEKDGAKRSSPATEAGE